jgi:hypothetical protein
MKRRLAIFALLVASSAFGEQGLTGHWANQSNIAENETDVECKLAVTDNQITVGGHPDCTLAGNPPQYFIPALLQRSLVNPL